MNLAATMAHPLPAPLVPETSESLLHQVHALDAMRRTLAVGNCLAQAASTLAAIERITDLVCGIDAARAQRSGPTRWPDAPTTTTPEMISAGAQLLSAIPQALRSLRRPPVTSFATAMAPVWGSLARLQSLGLPVLGPITPADPPGYRTPSAGHVTAVRGASGTVHALSVPATWMNATTIPGTRPSDDLGHRYRYAGEATHSTAPVLRLVGGTAAACRALS